MIKDRMNLKGWSVQFHQANSIKLNLHLLRKLISLSHRNLKLVDKWSPIYNFRNIEVEQN